MNKIKSSYSSVFIKTRDFAVTHKPTAPSNPPRKYDEYVNMLTSSIDGMDKAAKQLVKYPLKTATGELGEARRELWKQQVLLREIAQGVNFSMPGFIDAFRVPHPHTRISAQLDFARATVEKARVHKTLFTERGRPADFVEQLERAIARVVTARTAWNNIQSARNIALGDLEAACNQGREALANLNGIFQTLYANDPDKLAAWETAMQSGYRKNPKKKEDSEEVAKVA